MINEHILDKPEVTFTYFVSDLKKSGGKYETITGKVKKINYYNNVIIFLKAVKRRVGCIDLQREHTFGESMCGKQG